MITERTKFKDEVVVSRPPNVSDGLKLSAHWRIERFRDEKALEKGDSYLTSEFEHNLALNEGLNALFSLLCGGSETSYSNANAQLGVGESDVAEVATQTDLQGSSKTWKAMDGGFPTYGSSQLAVWKSTFLSADANNAWKEFSVRNGASADKNLNRKVSDQGTKTSGQTWILTLTITGS